LGFNLNHPTSALLLLNPTLHLFTNTPSYPIYTLNSLTLLAEPRFRIDIANAGVAYEMLSQMVQTFLPIPGGPTSLHLPGPTGADLPNPIDPNNPSTAADAAIAAAALAGGSALGGNASAAASADASTNASSTVSTTASGAASARASAGPSGTASARASAAASASKPSLSAPGPASKKAKANEANGSS
jgi:hypothetical protein